MAGSRERHRPGPRQGTPTRHGLKASRGFFTPTPRSASAARPARWPATSGTTCRPAEQPTDQPGCKPAGLSGNSYDNTGGFSDVNWRHVKFIEQFSARPPRGGLADDVRRLQALRQRPLPGGLPDRGDHPHRVRHRLHPGAACNGCRDCVSACPFGVIHMSGGAPGRARPRSAPSATTGCRTACSPPVRPGVSDPVDPVRAHRRAQEAGQKRVAPCRRRADASAALRRRRADSRAG